MDDLEGVSPQQQLEKKIEEQWYKWTDEHGLYDNNTIFGVDDEGNMELWVDTINHTTLSLYDNDSNFLNFRDIVDDHDNLNESVIAESFINAVNDFDPDDTFNELWSPELGERSSLKPSEFIKMLTEDKDYYEEKALKLNDEYGLSMDIDGPSMNI